MIISKICLLKDYKKLKGIKGGTQLKKAKNLFIFCQDNKALPSSDTTLM